MTLEQLIQACSEDCINHAKTMAAEIVAELSAEELAQAIPSWQHQAAVVSRRPFTPDTTGAYFILEAHYCAQFAAKALQQ